MLPILPLLLVVTPAQRACSLGAAWGTTQSSAPIRNILRQSDGALTWNHVPVSKEVLGRYLHNAARISPLPEMVVDTSGMRCDEQQRITREVAADYPCTPEYCRAYEIARMPLPPAPSPSRF